MMVSELATIRSLLIRAWRERWTDVQWGIHIKTVLPLYISGDIYHLSDCLLQQALMGSLPNNLILSYLKHSLSSQIVSHRGVIDSISKFDGFSKPYCIHALLDLLSSIMKSISCRGKPEDCLILATSLVAGVKWLIQVMILATEKLIDLKTAPEHTANLNLAGSVLIDILQSSFLMCMLQIGSKEDTGLWTECTSLISKLNNKVSGTTSIIDGKENLMKTLMEIQDKKLVSSLYGLRSFKGPTIPFNHSVNTLVMLEVILHPTKDAKVFAHQLLLLKELKGLTLTEIYLELLKACFIGMSAPEYKQYQELKWAGFTYIKVPNIIQTMHSVIHGESNLGPSDELFAAVKRLSSMTTLLDVADHRVNCNCLEYLLKEFLPTGTSQSTLLQERDAQSILANRMVESNVLNNLQNNESQRSRPGNPHHILFAHPPAVNILKALSNKNMDSVLAILSRLISGKNRELLLIAATSSGNLHTYAQKFVKLNEQSKEGLPGETAKMAINRAVVFDISFLLLCHIAQINGTDVVVSEAKETFVERWIHDNIPEKGNAKLAIHPNETVQPSVIEEFLRQIDSSESETKYLQCNWAEATRVVCLALKEVLCASHHGHVMKQMIFDLLNRISSHCCSLAVCVSAWLCSYIQQGDQEEGSQALEILSYMKNNLASLDSAAVCLDNFKDRSNMMSEIIENMFSVMEGSSQMEYGSLSSNEAPSPLSTLTKSVWNDINATAGLVSHKALSVSQDLLRLGGTKWFVSSFVKAAMEKIFSAELNRSIDIVYSLFHMDIVGCTVNLLVHTLPDYINGPLTTELLCEPRTSALARLTAMMLVSCWAAVQPNQTSNQETNSGSISPLAPLTPTNRGKKRSYLLVDLEDLQGKLTDQINDFGPDYSSLNLAPEGTAFITALQSLYRLITQVTRTGVVSPVTHFIVYLLKELVSFPHTVTLLDLPTPLLNNLLHMLSPPLSFDYPQLLALTSPERIQETLPPLLGDMANCTAARAKASRQAAAKILCLQRGLELTSSLGPFGDAEKVNGTNGALLGWRQTCS